MPAKDTNTKIPQGKFGTVVYAPETAGIEACGLPTSVSTDDWSGKTVILFATPGAFTPTCHKQHLPDYFKAYQSLKGKVPNLILGVVAANDPFVTSAWVKSHGIKDEIISLTDENAQWSKALGDLLGLTLYKDLGGSFGRRTGRYAVIIHNLELKYIGYEDGTDPGAYDASKPEYVLAKLDQLNLK